MRKTLKKNKFMNHVSKCFMNNSPLGVSAALQANQGGVEEVVLLFFIIFKI